MLAFVSATAFSQSAKAEFTTGLINVDLKFLFNTPVQVGPAVVGSAGDLWNGDPRNLLLSTGGQSGVSYALAGGSGVFGPETVFAQTPYAALMSDGLLIGANRTLTLSFSGLTPFQQYDFYFYSSFAKPSGIDVRTTNFSDTNALLTAITVGPLSQFLEGNNYVHFRDDRADAGGHLLFFINGSGGEPDSYPSFMGGIVNGFQILAVPEPGAMSSLAAGALSLLLWARLSSARLPVARFISGAGACESIVVQAPLPPL